MDRTQLSKDIDALQGIALRLSQYCERNEHSEQSEQLSRQEIDALTVALAKIEDCFPRVRSSQPKALEAAYQSLSVILESIQDLFYSVDREWRFTYVNQQAEKSWGKTQSELIGQEVWKVFPESVGTFSYDQLQQAMRERQTLHFENISSVLHTWIDVHVYPSADGGLTVYFRDISDRKSAEEALRESEEHFRRAIMAAPYPIMIHAEDGEVILINTAWTEMSGYTLEQIPTTQAWARRAYGKEEKRVRAQIAHLFELDQPLAEGEFEIHAANGQKRVWDFSAAPLGTTPDNRKMVISIAVDVSERKQADQALQASEERYHSLFDTITEGMALCETHCDPSGNPCDYRFLEVNPAFEQMINLSREQVLGRPLEEVFSGSDDHWIKLYTEVAGSGSPAHFRYYSSSLGKHLDVIAFSPQKGRFAVLFIDVTARVRAEAEARRLVVDSEIKHRLIDQREQERRQIARDLHDGPVQDLTAAMYLLHGLTTEPLSTDVLDILETVKASLQKQATELRMYAMELRPPVLSQFGLEDTLRSHLDVFREKHPDIDIRFEAQQEGDILPETSRVALFRIYQETLNNIVKHAQASQVDIRLTKTRRQASMEIQDNGVGFSLPDEWLSLARGGHLGLVGIRERVDALGGQVEIKSEPGKGTLVKVEVPLSEAN